jgi:aminocarboxymuconate-semialdehyde decarboxylase
VHAHHFAASLPDLARSSGDDRWPHLVTGDGRTGQILLGERVFRTVRGALWDLDQRLAEMDEAGIAVQVVSPVPIMLTYWAQPQPATEFARAINDSIAADVSASGGRLRGLGAVALQDPAAAADEARRVADDLHLDGVEIGANAAGRELDDPELEPFWSAVEERDLAVFVHPLDGGGHAIRREGQPYEFGLGMLTDTAMAAVALINGGVLDRHPALRVALAHGCGTFAWAFPRLRVGSQMSPTPEIGARYAELARRLWVDTLVLDPEHLRLLALRFGAGHILFGSDFPFMPDELVKGPQLIKSAAESGALAADAVSRVLGANAHDFLRRR